MSTNVYQVYVNGNELVFEDSNKKLCLRRALRLAKSCCNYVELWYVYSNGKRVLVEYWN